MDNREAQITWMNAEFYTGGLDGIIGPKSRKAMQHIFSELDTHPLGRWEVTDRRAVIAAAQLCLKNLHFEPGAIDGLDGHNTQEAFNAMLYYLTTGEIEKVDRSPVAHVAHGDIPKQSELRKYYGDPETEVPNQLTMIELPFVMQIDYNLLQHTNKITVHDLAAPSLEAALIEVHHEYMGDAPGIDNRWRQLGLNRYAGCYNKRKMRGGSSWSTHAYGCAIDFHAQLNGLRTRCPDALFCGQEYVKFLDIMESHGWLPAIRLWGADAMHFQRATL